MEEIFNRTIFFLFSFFFSLRCLSASKCEHSVKRHKENNVRMADKASIATMEHTGCHLVRPLQFFSQYNAYIDQLFVSIKMFIEKSILQKYSTIWTPHRSMKKKQSMKHSLTMNRL